MSCTNNGTSYSEGALICSNGRELRCSGGGWQETGYSCLTSSDEQSYQKIADDGLSSGVSGEEPSNFTNSSALPSLLQCCKYVLGAPFGSVRVYNSCPSCKVVTISFGNGVVQKHQVMGNDYKDVYLVDGNSQLVGEQAC